jgi:hypothetical protein
LQLVLDFSDVCPTFCMLQRGLPAGCLSREKAFHSVTHFRDRLYSQKTGDPIMGMNNSKCLRSVTTIIWNDKYNTKATSEERES